jgi:hypothetical protein
LTDVYANKWQKSKQFWGRNLLPEKYYVYWNLNEFRIDIHWFQMNFYLKSNKKNHWDSEDKKIKQIMSWKYIISITVLVY